MSRRLVTIGLLASIPAVAGDGWDVEWEMSERQWRSDSISWAQAIHPNPPTATELQQNVVPPPREMWCVHPADFEMYCAAWNHSMEQWLHHYLNIHYDEALPTDLPPFPKECTSTCSTW